MQRLAQGSSLTCSQWGRMGAGQKFLLHVWTFPQCLLQSQSATLSLSLWGWDQTKG